MRVITDFISKTYYFVDLKALKSIVNALPSVNISTEICYTSTKFVYICSDSILNCVYILQLNIKKNPLSIPEE